MKNVTRDWLAELTALDARDRMLRGEFTSAELCEACLRRTAAREPEIGAFAYLDEDHVKAAAKAVDAYRGTGRAPGALHGLPIGVKDIIDTADMPTENGTVLDAGRRPGRDAELVRRLRQAGAVVMGKTVTTELAFFAPGKTRNPHDLNRTPGGSSSGSAAAVAASMLPLAIGSQTFGSVIRPASFCGIVGFKPTFGMISRTGVRPLAPALDTIGVFARNVPDAALLADALAGHDPADRDTSLMPPPRMLELALTDPPVTPALAFVKTPSWDQAEPATKEAFAELVALLDKSCTEVVLPDVFSEWMQAQRDLMYAAMARHLEPYYRRGKEKLSPPLRNLLEEGMKIPAVDYLAALDWRTALNNGLEQLFDRYDAIVTPAAPGEAPEGLGSTGNPAFNGLWTFCGVPAVTLPLLEGPHGLPLGVQLVGRYGEDARLLRTARWLVRTVESAA
jgi:Asp-tRNA(Asn)/Glu-tRNA(Gln) amidotransferase A subunit family amidase